MFRHQLPIKKKILTSLWIITLFNHRCGIINGKIQALDTEEWKWLRVKVYLSFVREHGSSTQDGVPIRHPGSGTALC